MLKRLRNVRFFRVGGTVGGGGGVKSLRDVRPFRGNPLGGGGEVLTRLRDVRPFRGRRRNPLFTESGLSFGLTAAGKHHITL